jgi:hypothetical protein
MWRSPTKQLNVEVTRLSGLKYSVVSPVHSGKWPKYYHNYLTRISFHCYHVITYH